MTDDTRDRDVTVLVVDDEPDVLSLYAAWLAEFYDVRTASGGEEALEVFDESVDVVLLDRRMPRMTGDDVLEEVRGDTTDVRVAMITAVEPDVDIIDMPFDDYLVKPVDTEDLRATVELLLDRQRYDEKSRELFRLASKRAAIENAQRDPSDDPAYRELVDRMEDLRESIDATLDEIGPEEYEAAFRDLD